MPGVVCQKPIRPAVHRRQQDWHIGGVADHMARCNAMCFRRSWDYLGLRLLDQMNEVVEQSSGKILFHLFMHPCCQQQAAAA